MASAKQIAWRKKFAKMAKSGKFRKKKKITTAEYDKSGRMVSFGNPRKRMANPHPKEEGEIKRVEGGKVEVIETICHDWRGYLIDCETHKIIGEGYSHDPNWESLKDKDWRTV